MTMPGLLALSSNVGTILIADKLGKQKVYEYQQKFGLGRATGEGMQGEATGQDPRAGRVERVGVGLGADRDECGRHAGADGGRVRGDREQRHLHPAAPDQVDDLRPGRQGHRAPPSRSRTRCCGPEVAAELRTMMEAVVDNDDATGTQAAVAGYRVAGKTGTGKRLIDGQYTEQQLRLVHRHGAGRQPAVRHRGVGRGADGHRR